MGVSLGRLAVRYGCELRGDPDRIVERVGTLASADEQSLAFLANTAYRSQLASTRAAAVILSAADAANCPVDALIAGDPYVVYARVAAELHPNPPAEPGVHPSAVVGSECIVPASCEVGAGVVLQGGPLSVDIGYRYKKISPGNTIASLLNAGQDYKVNEVRVGIGVRF